MKRLWLFSATAGLLLGSAVPPPSPAASRQPYEGCAQGAPCAESADAAPATPAVPVAAPDPAEIAAVPAVPAPVPTVPAASAPVPQDTPWTAGVPADPPAGTQSEAPAPADEVVPAAPPAPPRPAARPGGVRVVISIPQQKAYVFRNGDLLATSPVSTGKRGHETPVGTFPILQKKVHHRSSKYDNAPMPYMQRLTHHGVALHAGSLPGYPASHGCIRLPRSFAKKLYGLTNYGTRVTVTNRRPKSSKEALKLA